MWKPQNNCNNGVMIGRWNLDYDNTIQNRKVYWANMDHCGCCDTAIFNIEKHKLKINVQDSKKNIINYNNSDEYLLPYVI